MNRILDAIADDDLSAVELLLKQDGTLATRLIQKPKLYNSRILHWMYVGDTALHLAAAGHRAKIVKSLLAAGSDPNAAKNHRRSTPLHYAADGFVIHPSWNEKNQVETLRCLLRSGANIDWPDQNGATALHRAVRTRCAAAVRCLLRAGSDPMRRNKPGSTPFHLAVQNTGRGGSGAASAVSAQRQIIEEFLSAGVSPKLRNAQGKSVMASARSTWIKEMLAGGNR